MATTTKRTTTGKCTGTYVVQHLHQRPARTRRHSQLHLCRRLVHRVARKRLQQHRSVTHGCPEHYDHLLRHEPTACEPFKDTGMCFPPRNRTTKQELNVEWNGTKLSNTTIPVYLGIHLDRTLCSKTNIEKTKMKVNARNNIIRKLANSKWGCKASTLRPSCLALCYSAAEYACPVCARSTRARKLNPTLHDCCRIISGCLKPTNLDSVHLLAGIGPPHIRRTVACRMERARQTTDARHQLFDHQPAASRLKSRKSFMRTVTPLDSSESSSRLRFWKDRRASLRQKGTVGGRVFAGWIWRGLTLLASSKPTSHRGGPCENSDEEMWLSRRWSVGGLRLRGATDDCPPPLLPPTRRGLHG